MPTPVERYTNIERPETLRVPDLSLPATGHNSVESWVESVGELVKKENLELTALESIASSLNKIDERDEEEAEQRKQDVHEARKREKNMTRLTWASVIMVGFTLLITGYGIFFSGQNSLAPEQLTPAVTSEPTQAPSMPTAPTTEDPSIPDTQPAETLTP